MGILLSKVKILVVFPAERAQEGPKMNDSLDALQGHWSRPLTWDSGSIFVSVTEFPMTGASLLERYRLLALYSPSPVRTVLRSHGH